MRQSVTFSAFFPTLCLYFILWQLFCGFIKKQLWSIFNGRSEKGMSCVSLSVCLLGLDIVLLFIDVVHRVFLKKKH